MADAHDEGGRPRSPSTARVRVNGRRIHIDLIEGRIVKGPPALIGKFICSEQIADIIEVGDYKGRLCTAENENDLRLAEAEYQYLRPRERTMQTPVTPGITVQYGNHGLFRVIGQQADGVVLQRSDGKKMMIPLHRYLNETTVSSEPVHVQQPDPIDNPYERIGNKGMETEGSVHLNESDVDRVIRERVDLIMNDEAMMNVLVDRLASRLTTTLDRSGDISPGDALVSSDDNGEPEA